jgi:Na+-transporting NADH:ubiquinone oxidoreductase subunit A
VADPKTRPHAIFVTAIDTEPFAPQVDVVLEGAHGPFERGVTALSRLTDGPVYVCTALGGGVPIPAGDRIRHEEFAGVHPTGTAGLHIHLLDPVDREKLVWHVGYQDVVAIGRLFETGTLTVDRVVALAGPAQRRPRLVRTRLGASTADLLADEPVEEETRVVSGSLLSGRLAAGDTTGFLGRYHRQVCLIREGRDRELLGWLVPGLKKFSAARVFLSKLLPGRRFAFTTSTNGSPRAIVPVGMYEAVMPMDLLPTPLLRALVMQDVERAEELGCLELDEEDLALCTFVCPSKLDYGAALRAVLRTIETEG